MKEEKEFNPLEHWSKDQVKSALKAHTKTELLKIAMIWRYKAEECKYIHNELFDRYEELKETNNDTTTEDTPHKADS